MRYYDQKRLKGLGNRCEVTMYIPPERLQEIAEDRTSGMVNYFLTAANDRGLAYIRNLECLVRSAYLQGANDVATAWAMKAVREGETGSNREGI